MAIRDFVQYRPANVCSTPFCSNKRTKRTGICKICTSKARYQRIKAKFSVCKFAGCENKCKKDYCRTHVAESPSNDYCAAGQEIELKKELRSKRRRVGSSVRRQGLKVGGTVNDKVKKRAIQTDPGFYVSGFILSQPLVDMDAQRERELANTQWPYFYPRPKPANR
jgi:hypothetical protein